MDRLTEKIYKKYRLCKVCGMRYGNDYKVDDGLCPVHSRTNYKKGGNRVKRILERRKK